MPPRIGIIADDFTSAMDGAGPFVASGAAARAVAILVGGEAPAGCDLVSVDTDSRARPAADAAELTRTACAAARDADVLYKTVDSTLRGHLPLEIAAAREASGRRRVVFAPAFPAAGRTTRDGLQLLGGVDLGRSSFAADARQAVATGRIADLLAPLACAPWAPGTAPPPDEVIAVCDAETDADLDAVVAGAPDDEVLWIGSPGMAHALARKHARPDTARARIEPVERVAVVVGSLHAINRAQLARLDGRATIVQAPPVTDAVTPESAAAVAADLAAQARALLADGYRGLIVTGGETVRAVVASLDSPSVEVLDEPQPGIVRGRLAGGALLVTKAGGFGDEDTMVALHELLTRGSA